MAVNYIVQPYIQSDGTVMHIYVADAEVDKPAQCAAGCKVFVKETDKWYTRTTGNAWAEDAGAGGAHPDLATHTGMGLSANHAHPYSGDSHNHDASYSGTAHNHDAAYSATGHGHVHNHDGTYSLDGHSHGGGGGEAFPPGSVFLSVVPTNPATLLGYGVWASIASGRMLVGFNGSDPDFDAPEKFGGAKTHTLTEAEMPSHTHVEQNNSATTGALAGWGARDTSTNTAVATGYSTQATGGGGAHNNVPPYFVVYIWKRTS